MTNTVYGYVRVSTKEQNEARQMQALVCCGVEREHIYIDKLSGRDFNRPQYARLMRRLKKGDTLVIKSIDRLGRNNKEIMTQWQRITREKAADIVVLDMPLLDTGSSRNLVGTLIADIVLELFSYVAQTECEFIRQRQSEGIALSKARGVRFGARPKEKPPGYVETHALWASGEISAREAARRLNVTHPTFLKWAREKI